VSICGGDPLFQSFYDVFLFEDVPAHDIRVDELYLDEVEGSPLFCMGNTMPPTSTEADHRRGVLNMDPPLLSKCPEFHHQDISLIGYLNPISPP